MQRNIQYLVVLAGLLFSLYACEFSPSEIPLTEIEPPSANVPAIRIELKPEMDTLRLSEDAWVTYSVETGDNKLYRIDFQFDSIAIGDLSYESDKKVSAYIHTNLIENGIHELKIITYTATNSGSIADKIGSEVYRYEIKWPVFVNKQAKDNFKFNSLKFVPEGIMVSWPEYNYADFNRYEFSWSYANSQNGGVNITDPRQNSYIDNKYVEGCYAYYCVFVYYTAGGFRFDNLTYCKNITNPVVHVNGDCSVDIRWTHSKNEQYVQLYCIKTSAPNYGIPEEHDLTDLNDTTLRLNEKIGFGSDYQAQLRYIPQGFNNYHTILNTAGGLINFAIGDSVPRFQKAFHITAENSLLIYNEETLSKYNLITGESSATIPVASVENVYLWTMTGSPDGNYIGCFDNKEYEIRRSSDFSIIKKMDIAAYDGFNLTLNDISISNNGLIATADYFNNLRIFNSTSGQKIFEKNFNSDYLRKAILSPDGKNLAVMLNDYSLNTTSLVYFSFDGNQLKELGRVHGVGEDVGAVLAFAPQSEQKVIVSRWRAMYEYNVEVRDSHTFELLHSVEVPMLFVPVVYDYKTDQVIAQYQSFPTEKYSYLIDLKTGTRKKTVQFAGKEPLVFISGNVLSGNGRSIRIEDYIIK